MSNQVLCLIGCLAVVSHPGESSASNPSEIRSTLYVSKLGDNSDGSSWQRAFTTIQAALAAVPDDNGGHRVAIRPDTYMEANLFPAHKGAKGAYNLLVGDYDGSLGSGVSGWVVIDSGVPDKVVRTDPDGATGNPGFMILDSGGPEKGLKSVDWWGPFRCDPNFSAGVCDRWIFRHIYSTGSEGGMGWDMTADLGAEFSVIVEDCFGIGRAFGGIVAGFVSRPEEPVIYRRCQLWSLDWWGDTAGMYVRSENPEPHDHLDVVMEDCTMVSPQCSLKVGNPGYGGYSRIQLKDCRLVTLNFSQPHGTPSPGIIQSVVDGKYLAVDLEDCTLMGYKVFGVRKNEETEKDIKYTTKGSVRAYVQYRQGVPDGFLALDYWPTDIFQSIVPPMPPPSRPALVKEELVRRDMCELSPLVWKGRLCHMECVRPGSGGERRDYYLLLKDAETGEEMARFATGYGLACAHVQDDTFYAFASRFEDNNWNDVTLFKSTDLVNWEQKLVVKQTDTEHLFNSSVCEGPNGFVMSYETNDPAFPAFSVKFATSPDLVSWTKVPDVVFGTDRYTACPCIRFVDGYYYMMYLERRAPRWFFETYIARSKDLVTWELSPSNPVLTPEGVDEGINASDPDLVEFNGKTSVYYAVGDQRTWMNIKRAVYPGTAKEFFEGWFSGDGITTR